MGRKHLFSLIEIAVAMAVAAIGVAAIMALLPISLKSTSDSVGDTLAADVANTVIAQLDRAAWEHFEWIQGLSETKPNSVTNGVTNDKLQEYANQKLGTESYMVYPADGLQKGKFIFYFGAPNEKNDFAADVVCWKEKAANVKMTALDSTTGKPKTPISVPNHPDSKKPAMVRVFIEVSWPISKPYSKKVGTTTYYPRQSRTFVREYFDQTYYKTLSN